MSADMKKWAFDRHANPGIKNYWNKYISQEWRIEKGLKKYPFADFDGW